MRTLYSLGLAGCLALALILPLEAWSQFRFIGSSGSSSSSSSSTSVELVSLGATSNTIAGPGSFTDDRANPEQNTIYQVFGGAAVDVCLTILNRGRLGDVQTIVDGVEVGDVVKPRRTRARCFAAPTSIELGCRSGGTCDAVWRIDAI